MLLRPGEHGPADRIIDQVDRVALPAPFDQHLEPVVALIEASDHSFEAAPIGAQRGVDWPAV
jgi:hypothetical protein